MRGNPMNIDRLAAAQTPSDRLRNSEGRSLWLRRGAEGGRDLE